jgi:uncharacterized protein
VHRSVTEALPEIAALCARLGVRRLDLFGSAVRDDTEPHDIDVLVELGAVENRFDTYFELKSALEILLGRDVDLVMADALTNPFVRAAILDERQSIYAA